MTEQKSESVIDDIEEAIKWRPLMPLLRAAREEKDTAAKMEAIERAAAFVVRTLFQTDPYRHRVFMVYSLVADLARKDPRVRSVIEDMVK